ncbi:EscU/YscU/HrcU family type III secretion system export apparatus switch protein [Buchnera aphidicola]|uniref:EscU/YscU/HrcU family type III secretion system export apparatus switch protein n=1 Tax=Buchnera aphidicola TaxID=9 RepID=UPI003463E43D
MSNYEDKTEAPTKTKIKKAKKYGMNFYSKKLNSLFLLFIFLMVCFFFKYIFFSCLINIFRFSLIFDKKIVEDNFQEIICIFLYCCQQSFIVLFIIFFFLVLSTFFSPMLSKNFSYNIKAINFDIQRLNIFLGIKKNFSYVIFLKFFKILFTTMILFLFLTIYFSRNLVKIFSLIYKKFFISFSEGIKIIFEIHLFFLIFCIPIIFLDIFLKNYLYYKKLKMSHQELKEEFKSIEGNPQIKLKIREKMKFLIKQKNILEIQKADIIITKDRKYAIVLKYNENNMIAPKIIFKGSKYLFQKILKLGEEYQIFCVNFPFLAKVLYKKGKIGKYIPRELYESVADVFAWLWKLKKWKKEGGKYPQFQKKIYKLSNINISGKNK